MTTLTIVGENGINLGIAEIKTTLVVLAMRQTSQGEIILMVFIPNFTATYAITYLPKP